ncbi:polyphosphate polymerase domain-containing protein [Nesterenkonia sp. CL21]|uniref:polyphosphate polymerase domain-containing protein n=1 Tax=Nesterenkonia sp. CL21 TaxID=3064894 RepID=UPI002879AE7A|nr:polyphosphate polymerase domain-containing protein [Nesterenkonia sp. CL21]MDS2172230.1 polyphosphate polymerase domain-containing protein [Nesterenkonia sp. CL21]
MRLPHATPPGRMVESLAAGFAPITLDQLNAQAALQTRVDRKYVVHGPQVEALLRHLQEDPARVLEISGARAMRYRSLYFDTPDRVSYLQSTLRRRRRFKLRTRQYVDTGQAYLEIKRSGSRGETVKERTSHPYVQLDRFRGTADDDVAAALSSTGVDPARIEELVPSLGTAYRRTTVLLPAAEPGEPPSRMTIDTDLQWTRHVSTAEAGSTPARSESLTTPGLAVVETKSASGAGQADRILWQLGVRPTRLSKYCTGLAALCPELPATPWKRTLRRHFASGIHHGESLPSR